MTGWEFAKQYLNPLVLFFRVCWAGMGALVALVTHASFSGATAAFGWAFALLLFWLALRPWKMYSINDVNKRVDAVRQRLDR